MKGLEKRNGEFMEWRDENHSEDKKRLITQMVKDFLDQMEDRQEMGLDPLLAEFTSKGSNYFIIRLRESRNPSMNCNGGDYDCWAEYSATRRWICRRSEWSADWDIMDYGGVDESYHVSGRGLKDLLKKALLDAKASWKRVQEILNLPFEQVKVGEKDDSVGTKFYQESYLVLYPQSHVEYVQDSIRSWTGTESCPMGGTVDRSSIDDYELSAAEYRRVESAVACQLVPSKKQASRNDPWMDHFVACPKCGGWAKLYDDEIICSCA